MKVVIKDTNVLIDVEAMGLLDLWFQLGVETLTSAFIIEELENGKHRSALAYYSSGQIRVPSIETEAILPLYMEMESSGTSLADISVLYLALKNDAILLTGDSSLRTQAEAREVECHGTLWILEKLIASDLLRPKVAAQKLEDLIGQTGQRRRFLPIKTVRQHILRWSRLN